MASAYGVDEAYFKYAGGGNQPGVEAKVRAALSAQLDSLLTTWIALRSLSWA